MLNLRSIQKEVSYIRYNHNIIPFELISEIVEDTIFGKTLNCYINYRGYTISAQINKLGGIILDKEIETKILPLLDIDLIERPNCIISIKDELFDYLYNIILLFIQKVKLEIKSQIIYTDFIDIIDENDVSIQRPNYSEIINYLHFLIETYLNY